MCHRLGWENFRYMKWKLRLLVSSCTYAAKMTQPSSLRGQSTAPPIPSSLFSFKKMLIDYRSWKSCPKCIFTMRSEPFRNCIRSLYFYSTFIPWGLIMWLWVWLGSMSLAELRTFFGSSFYAVWMSYSSEKLSDYAAEYFELDWWRLILKKYGLVFQIVDLITKFKQP